MWYQLVIVCVDFTKTKCTMDGYVQGGRAQCALLHEVMEVQIGHDESQFFCSLKH